MKNDLTGPQQQLLPLYTAWLRAAGCADRTIDARVCAARRLLDAAGGDPAAITALHATAYIGAVESPWSRATYYGHAAAFARFLAAMDLGGAWLAKLPKPRPRRGTPRPVTDTQLMRALGVAEPRTRTMLLLGAYQGLRVSEIARVNGADVTEETLRVTGKGGRRQALPTHPLVWREAARYPSDSWWFTASYAGRLSVQQRREVVAQVAAGARPVDVAREYRIARQNVSRWVQLHAAGGDAALGRDPCARPVGRWTVWAAIEAAFASAGVEATPHQLRHWHATALLRSGANIRVVQELMRHASLASTQIYTQVDDADRRRAIDSLPTLAALDEARGGVA